MPKVGGKEYAYSPKGLKQAENARKRLKNKKKKKRLTA